MTAVQTRRLSHPHPARRISSALAALLALAACGGSSPPDPVPAGQPAIPAFLTDGIEIGPDGRCFATDISPAIIETVTAQVLDRPAVIAPDGTVASPAAYRTVTRQEITRERSEITFETLCPPAYTADFVSSLQRALALRGFYAGPVTGIMDIPTGRAVQDFQRVDGPDSPILSIEAARTLGLAQLTTEQIDRL
jgi:hypothetical protein